MTNVEEMTFVLRASSFFRHSTFILDAMLFAFLDQSIAQACVAAAFCLVLGGVIGSFLNVVVYRMPSGLSLSRPGSHCPTCEKPIRRRDNVPVLGWLALRGKCRDCGAPISKRYPLIELVTALMFLVLALLEPIGFGVNLPDVALSNQQWWAMAAWHATLLSALLCAALIEHDGHRLPRRFAVLLFLVGLAGPSIWPFLHPVPPLSTLDAWLGEQAWAIAPVSAAAGMIVGLVMGCLASPVTGEGPSGEPGRESAFDVLMWSGLFLGWQAAAAIAAAASVAFSLATMYKPGWQRLRNVPFAGCMLVATALWIVNWKEIVERVPRLGLTANHLTLAVSGGIVVVVCSVAKALCAKREVMSDK